MIFSGISPVSLFSLWHILWQFQASKKSEIGTSLFGWTTRHLWIWNCDKVSQVDIASHASVIWSMTSFCYVKTVHKLKLTPYLQSMHEGAKNHEGNETCAPFAIYM